MAFSFKDCNLSLSSFTDMTINKTQFNACKMHQVDFTSTEAKSCQFIKCDFQNAIFNNANLEASDFSTAYNFDINPSSNYLKSALFSKENLFGLLKSFSIKVK